MKKKITVGNEEIEFSEFECQANERLEYGLSIYLVTWVPCKVWEYLMPSGTLREQQYRGINNLWVDFIQGGNKLELLNQFVDKLSSHTGINFHVATKDTMPRSIYDRLTELGMSLREDSDSVTLVAYANNKKKQAKTTSSNSRTYSFDEILRPPKRNSCFLTTAMCKYYGKPDDCPELNQLRQFRDTWMSSSEEGRSLISEYYEIAPHIVNAIDNDSHHDQVYEMIKNIIDQCINLIEYGDNVECLNAYKGMVATLASKYNIKRI